MLLTEASTKIGKNENKTCPLYFARKFSHSEDKLDVYRFNGELISRINRAVISLNVFAKSCCSFPSFVLGERFPPRSLREKINTAGSKAIICPNLSLTRPKI